MSAQPAIDAEAGPEPLSRNHVWVWFMDPGRRTLSSGDWATSARLLVAKFRGDSARNIGDPYGEVSETAGRRPSLLLDAAIASAGPEGERNTLVVADGDTLVVDTTGFEPTHGITTIPGGGFRTASARSMEKSYVLRSKAFALPCIM